MRYGIKSSHVFATTGILWCSLGFARGLQDYDYTYAENKQNVENKGTYLYSSRIGKGFVGLFLYAFPILPIFIIPIIPKEIYRLEVGLRGLEEEKKGDYYNKLL